MDPRSPAGQVSSAQDADKLVELLNKHKDDGVLSDVFKSDPMILAHALKSLDDDENVLFKFLCKHRHVVGKFLEQHSNIDVLAEFLAKYPTAMHQILDEERSIFENFVNDNPEALQAYIDAKSEDLIQKHLESKPEKFHTFMCGNPKILSDFCDKHPRFMAAWLENRQATVQDYLMASPAYFWNHIISHPSCNMSAHIYGTSFTASFLVDIPEDQHDLIRLSIERCLPRDPRSRKKMLADIAERGESAILVEGYTERHNPWFDDETVKDLEELENAAAEDNRWLEADPNAEVPESLEWYPGKMLKVRPKKRNGNGPKSGEFPGMSKARPLLKKNTETRSSRKGSVAETFVESTSHPFPRGRATKSQKSGNTRRVDANQIEQDDDDIKIMPSFGLDAHAPHPSLHTSKSSVSATKKGKNDGRTPTLERNVKEQSGEQRSIHRRVSKSIKDLDTDGVDTDSEDEGPIGLKGRARRAHDSGRSLTRSAGKANSAHSQTAKTSTKFKKTESDDELDEEVDIRNDESDSDDEDDQDWGPKKGGSRIKAHTKKKAPLRPQPATAKKTTAKTKPFAASGVKVGVAITETGVEKLIPYPTPHWLILEDDKAKYNKREWPLSHQDCAIKHMLAVKAEGTIKGEGRFREATSRLNTELDTERTWFSIKNYWNRCGRERSGFDERTRKKVQLSTSLGVLKSKSERGKKARGAREIASIKRLEGRRLIDGTWLEGHSSSSTRSDDPTQQFHDTNDDPECTNDTDLGHGLDADDHQAVQNLLRLRDTPEQPSVGSLSPLHSSQHELGSGDSDVSEDEEDLEGQSVNSDDEDDEDDLAGHADAEGSNAASDEHMDSHAGLSDMDRALYGTPPTAPHGTHRHHVNDGTLATAHVDSTGDYGRETNDCTGLSANSAGTNGNKRKRDASEEEAELELNMIARSFMNGTRPKKQVKYHF